MSDGTQGKTPALAARGQRQFWHTKNAKDHFGQQLVELQLRNTQQVMQWDKPFPFSMFAC